MASPAEVFSGDGANAFASPSPIWLLAPLTSLLFSMLPTAAAAAVATEEHTEAEMWTMTSPFTRPLHVAMVLWGWAEVDEAEDVGPGRG